MRIFLFNMSLVILWLFMTGHFSLSNFFLGCLISYMVLWLSYRRIRPKYFRTIPKLILFLGFFLMELIKANLKVIYDIVTPRHHMKPGILCISLATTDELKITVFANLLTLTPGTLALEISHDKRYLFVHFMYIDNPDEAKRKIQQFEARVLELLE